MIKKYIIAQNKEELDANFKFIKDTYNNKTKKYKKTSLKWIQNIWKLYGKAEILYQFRPQLCNLYMEEIQLYYLVNSIRENLQIQKYYYQQKSERKKSIFLPIILSIIASIILGIYEAEIWRPVANIFSSYKDVWIKLGDLFITNPSIVSNIFFQLLYVIVLLILLGVFILICALLPMIPFILLINIISAFLGGLDFDKIIVEQYELDFIDKISSNDRYFELIDKIDECSNSFFNVINQLTFNIVVRKGFETFDSVEEKLTEYILDNEIINKTFDQTFLSICTRKIIIKSIIYKVFLKTNSKSPNLILKKNILSIKKKCA